MTDLSKIICPTCDKENTWHKENQFRPFCSDRCKLIDLGEWANESHKIAGQDNSIPEEIVNQIDSDLD